MRMDAAFGGVVPALSATEIVDLSPKLYELADLEICEFGKLPGPHVTPEIMLELSSLIQKYTEREDVQGVVVTHGTDTLEETAYFLDCTLNTEKPVVVIGSMRNSSEPDWDGPRNLRDGILIAVSPKARNHGVLVSLSEEIHAASEVSKNDTSNLHTFVTLNFGSIGRVVNGAVFLYRQPVHRDYFAVKDLPKFVPLIKCCAGMGEIFLNCAIENQAKGIVIEAMGVGNVPPPAYHQIVRAIENKIPVVLVSRCPIGRVEHIYAYEGAGKHLYEAGVIFADYLNGQKARIKLIAALSAGCDIEQLRESFEWSK